MSILPEYMAFQIQGRTFTGAWNYIVEKQIGCVDYFPKQDFSELLDKIAAM
jgi:hypothetical protein